MSIRNNHSLVGQNNTTNNNYFVINSAMRKIFNTKSQDIVDTCRDIFNCLPAESVVANRRYKFLCKIRVSENKLHCKYKLLSMSSLSILISIFFCLCTHFE